MNREIIAQIPRGSFLINTSRGGVADLLAVLDAITRGHFGGSGIGILEAAPPSAEHPLLQAWRGPAHPAHERLPRHPHSAFYSEEGLMDMRIKGSENCRHALLAEPVRNLVKGTI